MNAPITLGIIGTAGRGNDAYLLKPSTCQLMQGVAQSFVTLLGATRVVSGGAAWADSVPVYLFNTKQVSHLTLHLPCAFDTARALFDEATDVGRTLNHYHKAFAAVCGHSSLDDLVYAILNGADVTVQPPASGYGPFFARNAWVARDSDVLLAFTHGEKNGDGNLKDGGSAHTMQTYLKRRGVEDAPVYDEGPIAMGAYPFEAPAYHYCLTNRKLYSL